METTESISCGAVKDLIRKIDSDRVEVYGEKGIIELQIPWLGGDAND